MLLIAFKQERGFACFGDFEVLMDVSVRQQRKYRWQNGMRMLQRKNLQQLNKK
jgi:hypothetical protein